jgi:hypothetical protein
MFSRTPQFAGCFVAVAVALLLPPPSSATDDISAIIQRSVEANEADWRALVHFDFDEEDRDPSGGSKTYRELMIEGSRYARLIAVNGVPLSPEAEAQEQQKLDKVIAERKRESPDRRRKRIDAFQKGRERDHILLQQLARAFNFSMTGEDKLGAYEVYVLQATPRPGYQPPNLDAQVLTGMKGSLWIDKQSGEWVKAQADVIRPVTIGGFLARVEPDTEFELEKMPVQDGIWFPRHFSMHSRSKIFFVFAHHTQADETYSNYTEIGPR